MDILVVDDDPTNRKLLRAQLEAEGHTVLEAADGIEALRVVERESVAAVISDIMMPNMDGFRLCLEIRKLDRFRSLPFIFYTNTYTSPEDRKLAQTVGAELYVIKPAPMPVIREALREAVQKARTTIREAVPQHFEKYVLHQYSEALVRKLEEKNTELQKTLEELQAAHSDIQELNQSLENRVRQRTAELEAANKELESFSYSVSHDLRAPLRHIDGYVNMLVEDTQGQLAEEPRRFLKKISNASRQMSELIDDLLEFSRAGRAEMSEINVDLGPLVREAIANLDMATQGRSIAWNIPQLPRVVGDPSMLRQVLANLLSNAVKYSRSRNPAQIEIGLAGEEDGRLILFVRDNGVGFDMKYADKLFGVFQRLHRADQFEGTGIGLANVQRIITRHGGRIWAEAAPDQGATFYFTLQTAPSEPLR